MNLQALHSFLHGCNKIDCRPGLLERQVPQGILFNCSGHGTGPWARESCCPLIHHFVKFKILASSHTSTRLRPASRFHNIEASDFGQWLILMGLAGCKDGVKLLAMRCIHDTRRPYKSRESRPNLPIRQHGSSAKYSEHGHRSLPKN